MCRVLKVSRSGYYAWCKRPVSGRELANQKLIEQIEEIHQHSRQTYGSPRIHAELTNQGVQCGHNRVARLMRAAELRAKQNRKFKVRTTDSAHHYPVGNIILWGHRSSPSLPKLLPRAPCRNSTRQGHPTIQEPGLN